ncbi:MAG: nicotinamide-nucleotide amidohydrolase family protein [Acholeplasmatales bacterium]|jgi:PncC family amidohydrolase|nr:nicotinamide-nucleotide amidohydrolase family protein [Acholeplasmatales bacterium]
MENTVEKTLVELLLKNNMTISFAESCTGGMLASTLINVSGSSNAINESYVTYSEEAKMRILGVSKETLNKYTVYSSEVAEEMAEGLKKVTHANVCASVTGKAEDESGICKCDYCIIVNDSKVLENVSFQGSRNQVRTMQTKHIMNRIIEILRGYFG